MHASPLPAPLSRLTLLGLLIAGGTLLLFAMGHYTVPLAAWLAPVFLLRYTRQARSRWALILAWLVMFLAFLFQFWGMVPLPKAGMMAVAAGTAVGGLLPYALDRGLNRKTSGFQSTLIFPCALTSLDFSTSLSPYGSWGVLGYSQYGNLPIMQLSAVTGIYGISFLVAWLGAVVNWAWEHGFDWLAIRRGTLIFVGALSAVYLYGSARLLFSPPSAGQQRVSGVAAGGYSWKFPSRAVEDRFWSGATLSDEELAPVRRAHAEQAEKLFAKSEREANAGAKLVFWSETVVSVLKADEPALIEKGSGFASRNQVYLGMAFASFDRPRSKLNPNKLVLIGPDGRVLFEYWKSRPVPGGEQAAMETNGNPMRSTDTPLGRVGGFICFDLDFPSLVRQAGRERVDLVLGPANDWKAIDPWNTQMSVFRAVENGFNFVRNVSNGRSIAVDYLGRTIAETDFFTSPSHVIVADMPTRGVGTIYAKVGDLFAWLCLGTLAVLLATRFRRSWQPPA